MYELTYFAAYRRPFVVMPSNPCVGDTVTLPCEVLFTADGSTPVLISAIMLRDGTGIATNTIPNHMLLITNHIVVGVMINGVTLNDNGIEYTCNGTGVQQPDFGSSLTLNVTGT